MGNQPLSQSALIRALKGTVPAWGLSLSGKKRLCQRVSFGIISPMRKMTRLTSAIVKHIAKLANLDLSEEKLKEILPQLTSVIDFVSKVQSLNTNKVTETSQVTGLENVFREDIVDKSRMLSQEEALSNAKKTYKGYFEVDAIFE